MKRIIQSISMLVISLGIAFMQNVNGQSITQSPNRSNSLTVVGFFTNSPIIIDGALEEANWGKTYAAPDAASGGAGYNGTNFPKTNDLYTTEVKEQINTNDSGTDSPNTPPTNPYSDYASKSATLGVLWDLDYLYLAARVVDPVVAGSTGVLTSAGVEFFINNGNGRSEQASLAQNWPRAYNNDRDMQMVLNYVPAGTNVAKAPADFAAEFIGISPAAGAYEVAVKRTTDGWIVEAKISWSAINKEFINELTQEYSDNKWKPLKTRPGLGFDMSVNLTKADFTGRDSQIMWNQCCFNRNWTESKYFGYLQLAGDTTGLKCPTSVGVNFSPASIATASATSQATVSVSPTDATNAVDWSIEGVDGSNNPLAVINSSGVVTPLNNGSVTVTGRSIKTCSNVFGTAVLTISNQVVPTGFTITAADITTNWGESNLSVAALPAGAPAGVIWSIQSGGTLAKISTLNSISGTGKLISTGIGSGSVVIRATSIANPTVYSEKTVTINTPAPLTSCIGINAYSRFWQCNRTLNTVTVSGFATGERLDIRVEYFNQTLTIPGAVPASLISMTKTVGTNDPADLEIGSNGEWQLLFKSTAGTFTIDGVYLNKPEIKTRLRVTLRASTAEPCTIAGSNPYNITTGNYCGTVLGISDSFVDGNNSVSVYPNPASDLLNVDVDLAKGGALNVSVVNMLGVEVASSTSNVDAGKSSVSINTASLTSGVYVVKVGLVGGGSITKKLLISK